MKKKLTVRPVLVAAVGFLARVKSNWSAKSRAVAGVLQVVKRKLVAAAGAIGGMKRRLPIWPILLAAAGVLVLTLLCWLVLPPVLKLAHAGITAFYASLDVVKASALSIALAALCVAWNNYRRGNTAIVKLISVTQEGVQSLGVNNSQLFNRFEIRIKNLGIPLKNPSVALSAFTRFGRVLVPLKQFKDETPVVQEGPLEKGMVGCYGLRSFELIAGQRAFVSALVDPEANCVSIGIFSNGFLVKRFHLRSSGWRRRVKQSWNRLAWKVNERFQYTKVRWGRPHLHCPTIMPLLLDHYFALQEFDSCLKESPLPAQHFGSGPLFRAPTPGDEPLFKRQA